jgi:hypothetical protein
LLGRLTSPSQAAIEPLDREILALRHFEQLTNAEVTATLEMNESTASSVTCAL